MGHGHLIDPAARGTAPTRNPPGRGLRGTRRPRRRGDRAPAPRSAPGRRGARRPEPGRPSWAAPLRSRLLTAAEELGIELCNPHSADSLLRDRRSWLAALDRAGIAVPPSITVNRWHEVLDQAGTEHVVAKALVGPGRGVGVVTRSEEHTSELQSRGHLVCRLLLEKKKGR